MIQARLFQRIHGVLALLIVGTVAFFLWQTQWPEAQASSWTSQCALLVVDLTGPPATAQDNIDLALDLWQQLSLHQRSGLGAFAMVQGQDGHRDIQRLRIPSLKSESPEQERSKLRTQLTKLVSHPSQASTPAMDESTEERISSFFRTLKQTTTWLQANFQDVRYPWNVLCPSREILFVSDLPPQLSQDQQAQTESLLEELHQDTPALQRASFISTAEQVAKLPRQTPLVLSPEMYRTLRSSERHVLFLDLSNSLQGEGNPTVELAVKQALLERVLHTFEHRITHIPESYLDAYVFGAHVLPLGRTYQSSPAGTLVLRSEHIKEIGSDDTNLIAVFDQLQKSRPPSVFMHSDGANTIIPEGSTPDWSDRYCTPESNRGLPRGDLVLHLGYPSARAAEANLHRVRRAAKCLGYAVVDVAAR